MAEHISVRITNEKNEYVKTLSPVEYTTDDKAAYNPKVEVDAIDYEWVKENVLNAIERIYMNDGMQTLVVYMFDEFDRDFKQIILVYDPAGAVLGRDGTDPTATETPEMEKAAQMIRDNIVSEIRDICIRCVSSSKTVSASMSAAAAATGAPAGGAPSSTPDLDKLCEMISKNTKAEIVKPKETLADYVCNDLLHSELDEIVHFFEKAATYRSANVEIPKGILFKGPWGTGKTYAARCIAGSVDCYFMTCTASALQGQYVGSGAENIRQVFKGAKLLAEKSGKGVILFIDELDSFGDRQNRSGGASGEEDRTLNQLLAEMSGFTDVENIMVLAATNFPERLDSALMRSGRFGRQITIDYPDDEERKHMIEYYFKKISIPRESKADFDTITALTKGLTPADIKEISNEAGRLTIRQGKSEITLENINEAVNKVITKNIRHPDKSDDELKLVTAHECGHVLAEVLYKNTIPIKVTNYAYGDAGGFTQSSETLSGLQSKENFIAEVKMLLAGRAAEEVICGYITNGASNDLEKAKKILTTYYKYFNFEKYEVKELDQIVINKVDELYNEVVKDFKTDTNNAILQEIIKGLYTARVLYSEDIVTYVGKIRRVTL